MPLAGPVRCCGVSNIARFLELRFRHLIPRAITSAVLPMGQRVFQTAKHAATGENPSNDLTNVSLRSHREPAQPDEELIEQLSWRPEPLEVINRLSERHICSQGCELFIK